MQPLVCAIEIFKTNTEVVPLTLKEGPERAISTARAEAVGSTPSGNEEQWLNYHYCWEEDENPEKTAAIDTAFKWLAPREHDVVADFGCGNGRYLVKFKSMGVKYAIGTELSMKGARRALERTGYDVVLCDLQALPFIENAFDKILVYHVIEHTANLDATMHEINRVLKEGCISVIGYPNKDALVYRTRIAKQPPVHLQLIGYDWEPGALKLKRKKTFQSIKLYTDKIPAKLHLDRLLGPLFYNVLMLVEKQRTSTNMKSQMSK